jgi:peroxiredoxin Q/BCP
LQKELASLKEKKVRVVGISYDAIDVLVKFSDQQKITFPLLSDPDSDTIKAFQLMNAEAKGKIEGVPYPGTVILDKHGTIQAKLFFDGYRERHTPTDILKAVSEIK